MRGGNLINMNELNYGFDHREPAKALEELKSKLGSKNGWFVRFIGEVVKMKQHQNITDIVIKENQLIKVGAVKSFIPLLIKLELNGNIFKPSGDDINFLTHSLLGKDHSYLNSMSSIDFSLAIYGIGIFRINYSRDIMGVGLSIRYLDFDIPEFEGLQYPAYYKKFFETLIRERTLTDSDGKQHGIGYIGSGGLVLHIGPTGSGKTTAIASELRHIADRISGTIVTYENPVEYRFVQTKAIIRQYELGKHIKDQDKLSTFETLKYHLLRNAPSVAMISEVKTEQEIYELLDVANRGHLVFSTMHAKNTIEALSLMMSVMKSARHLLATSLLAIVSHYLHLTLHGKIVPIYEVFIPDKTVKKKIQDGNLVDIHRMFYQEKVLVQSSVTFPDFISELMNRGVLSDEEKKELLASMMFAFN